MGEQSSSGVTEAILNKINDAHKAIQVQRQILEKENGQLSDYEVKIKDAIRKQGLLEKVKAKEEARKEQTYTYRMWGIFTPVWENDVKLARRNKEDLERQAEILKHKIAKCKDDKVENIHEEMESTY